MTPGAEVCTEKRDSSVVVCRVTILSECTHPESNNKTWGIPDTHLLKAVSRHGMVVAHVWARFLGVKIFILEHITGNASNLRNREKL